MDPNWVVNHAYNAASYILEHDNPIGDGETIDGIENGRMSREIQWKCQYEDALIQPPRGVVDIIPLMPPLCPVSIHALLAESDAARYI